MTATAPNETNQMYVVGLTNYLGIEFWNSSTQTYNRPVRILATNFFTAVMTNELGTRIWSTPAFPAPQP